MNNSGKILLPNKIVNQFCIDKNDGLQPVSATAVLSLLPPGSSTGTFIVSEYNFQKVENLTITEI